MTELTYEVPTVGEKHQASDQRVSTALTEIKSVLNGRLTANNFAKETITVKKFAKSEKWTATTLATYLPPGNVLQGGESLEIPASSGNRLVALSLFFETGFEPNEALTLKVGGVVIVKVGFRGVAKQGWVPVGPFRVPGGEAILLEMPPLPGQIGKESIFSTQSGVA